MIRIVELIGRKDQRRIAELEDLLAATARERDDAVAKADHHEHQQHLAEHQLAEKDADLLRLAGWNRRLREQRDEARAARPDDRYRLAWQSARRHRAKLRAQLHRERALSAEARNALEDRLTDLQAANEAHCREAMGRVGMLRTHA